MFFKKKGEKTLEGMEGGCVFGQGGLGVDRVLKAEGFGKGGGIAFPVALHSECVGD